MPKPTAARVSRPKPIAEPNSLSAKNRKHHEKHREKRLEQMRARYAALPPLEKILISLRTRARPPHPGGGSWKRNPRANSLARAYCEWSDLDEVVRTYLAAGIMTELTGEPYVVDHVIPLNNPFVCGLHTHTNIEVITQAQNRRKGYMLYPGMSPLTWESMEMLEQLEKYR